MYNLLLSLLAGLVVSVALFFAKFSWLAAVVPGVLVAVGLYLVLARRVGVRFQAIVGQAQKELSVAPANNKERLQRIERAIRILEGGLAYDKWQFLIGPQVHAQIGMLRYTLRDFDNASRHFAKASARDYLANAFQGAMHFQKKNFAAMEQSFEVAVKGGKKEGLVWAAYAWCLAQAKEKDKALSVLARAVEQNPNDERLKSQLTALRNDKRLKMKAFEPNWWQFGLEQPPTEFAGGRRVQHQRH